MIPILPHVYTNIVREIFKKDNLYKKDKEEGKSKKPTENEIYLNKLDILNIVISNASVNTNGLNNNFNNDDIFTGMTFAIFEKEKGTFSIFYEELSKSSEYNTDFDEILLIIFKNTI